jgi:hypothetical protein
MLEPHQRAALIPIEPGVQWHHFLSSRFTEGQSGNTPSLAVIFQAIEQHSPVHATLRGLLELSVGSSLPVVTEFRGELNLEAREISIQAQPGRQYSGQFSGNGRVLVLRENGQTKSSHLVHAATLSELV